MGGRTVLVLGGGIGGVASANELRQRLARDDRVVVIERDREHLFQPSLLWLMVGRRRRERIERPLADLLGRGVEFVEAEVMGIDPAERRVETSTGDLSGDAIVIALGAESDPAAMPGFSEAAHDIYSADGAAACAHALATFEGGRVVVAVSSLPYKCPAAPYEAAMLLDDELRQRGVRDACEIDVYSPEPAPMPVAGVEMGSALLGLFAARGIRFHPGSRAERFEPTTAEVVFGDGSRSGYDLLVGIPPHRAPSVIGTSGLADDSGWIPVDHARLETPHENVFAIGDVTTITLANGKPLPRAGVFAHGEALTAARVIAARFAGSSAPPPYDGAGYCWVETGQGRAAFADGAFFAEPDPKVTLRRPGPSWHLGKVLFERSWIGGRLERRLAHVGLVVGGRLRGVRAEL